MATCDVGSHGVSRTRMPSVNNLSQPFKARSVCPSMQRSSPWTEGRIREALAPHYVTFRSIVDAAWARLLRTNPDDLLLQSPNARARVMHDYMVGEARRRGGPGTYREHKQAQLFEIEAGLMLQYRKLDRDGNPNGNDTDHGAALMNDGDQLLFDIPRTRVVVLGYMLDGSETKILDTRVVCMRGKGRQCFGWSIQPQFMEQPQTLDYVSTPKKSNEPRQRRVRARRLKEG